MFLGVSKPLAQSTSSSSLGNLLTVFPLFQREIPQNKTEVTNPKDPETRTIDFSKELANQKQYQKTQKRNEGISKKERETYQLSFVFYKRFIRRKARQLVHLPRDIREAIKKRSLIEISGQSFVTFLLSNFGKYLSSGKKIAKDLENYDMRFQDNFLCFLSFCCSFYVLESVPFW